MYAAGEIDLGEKIDVCVPTGKFGNIFACYMAKEMGLPIGKLVCASNKNKVLTDFSNPKSLIEKAIPKPLIFFISIGMESRYTRLGTCC
jgi:threonine synthase